MTTILRLHPGLTGALVASVGLLAGCSQTLLQNTIPPGEQIDSFAQNGHGQVDVLWVIKDAPDMADEQTNLANNFAQFFDVLEQQNVDYHIGVITTDITQNGGQLVGDPQVITTSTTGGLADFETNVEGLDTGNPIDEGLDAIRLASMPENPSFWRQDAYLFVIIVSDSDDQSEPGDAHYFYRLFSSLKGVGNNAMVNVSAIVGDTCDGGTCSPTGCFNPTGMWEAQAAPRYTQVAQAMGGIVASICDNSFAADLEALGLSAVGLTRAFPLTDTPKSGAPITVQVSVPNGTLANNYVTATNCSGEMPGPSSTTLCLAREADSDAGGANGWIYDTLNNSIIFEGSSVPPKGSTIQVTYTNAKATVQR